MTETVSDRVLTTRVRQVTFMKGATADYTAWREFCCGKIHGLSGLLPQTEKNGSATMTSRKKVTATVVNGSLQLDEPVDLPDQSRVDVTIETGAADKTSRPELSKSETAGRDVQSRREAFERFRKLTEEHPLHLGGRRFTREELHERD